jgi:hypothetical protein
VAYSITSGTVSGGVTTFPVPFPYLRPSHVHAYVNGAEVDIEWVTAGQVSIPAANGDTWVIKRETPKDELEVEHQPGNLSTGDLNKAQLQQLYVQQEQDDRLEVLEALAAAAGTDIESIQAFLDTLGPGSGDFLFLTGAAVPEGTISAPEGTVYKNTAALDGSKLLIKIDGGAGNTGWQEVQTTPFLNVRRGNLSAQDAKFAGKSGPFNGHGKSVVVDEFPSKSVYAYNGFWKRKKGGPSSPYNMRINYPMDPNSLPISRSVLTMGPRSSTHPQNTLFEDLGESYVYPHALSGPGTTSVDSVYRMRTQGGHTWTMKEELDASHAASPYGYVCLAAMGQHHIHMKATKRSNFQSEEPIVPATAWKWERCALARRIELPANPFRTVVGTSDLYLDRTKYDLTTYVGQVWTLSEADASVGGVTIPGSLTVAEVTDLTVRFTGGTGSASESTVGGGTLVVFRSSNLPFETLKFTGDVSFSTRLIAVGGLSEPPGVIHTMVFDRRTAGNLSAYVSFSKPGTSIMCVAYVTGICSANNITTFAEVAWVKEFSGGGFTSNYSEMAFRFVFNASGTPFLIGTSRTNNTDRMTLHWVWDLDLSHDPVTCKISGDNSLRASPMPLVVKYEGDEPWVFYFTTESRNPESGEQGYVDVLMGAAKLYDVLADPENAVDYIEWYFLGAVLWFDSSTGASAETSPVGVGTADKFPGGARFIFGTGAAIDGQGLAAGGTVIFKVDLRRFTGYRGHCYVDPDVVTFLDSPEMVFQGIASDVNPGNPIRLANRKRDDFLGCWKVTDAEFLCPATGHYEVESQLLVKSDGNAFRAFVRDETSGQPVVNSQYSDAVAVDVIRAKLPSGTELAVYGKDPDVYMLAGRKYAFRSAGGTVKADPMSWIRIAKKQ